MQIIHRSLWQNCLSNYTVCNIKTMSTILFFWFIPFIGVPLSDVLPLTLQQHGADVVLALQQQKGVQITAEHTEQSAATHTNKQDNKITWGQASWDTVAEQQHWAVWTVAHTVKQGRTMQTKTPFGLRVSLVISASALSVNTIFLHQLAVANCKLLLSRKPWGKASWLIFSCW